MVTVQQPRGDEELRRRQRVKNWTLLGVLIGFVVIIYLVTLARMGGI